MSITCTDATPPRPAVAVVQRSVRRDMPLPVLRVASKPAPKQSPVRVLCDPPQGAEPQPPIARTADRAVALPMLAALPAVPGAVIAEPVEPLAFDPPAAGPERTWTLASAPPPQWWPVVQPWSVQPLPVVPEPPTWALLLAGVGVMVLAHRLRPVMDAI